MPPAWMSIGLYDAWFFVFVHGTTSSTSRYLPVAGLRIDRRMPFSGASLSSYQETASAPVPEPESAFVVTPWGIHWVDVLSSPWKHQRSAAAAIEPNAPVEHDAP